MCGISGYYTTNGLLNPDDLRIMIKGLHHRGPDSEGIFFSDHIALGHNRLSIIDLSERGNQPMHSSNGRYVIVYNGEVYNYTEIAAQLRYKLANHSFQLTSSSDTEVILEAFAHYGCDFITQLNGMFAFGIYDKKEDALYLYRDRIGIKPLYYYWDGKNFIFSSEIKVFKNLEKINTELNPSVVPQYLYLGYIPSPHSIYKNIFKLEPGHFLKVSKHGVEKKQYWSVSRVLQKKPLENEKQAIVLTSDLLASSVQYQLKSDVPFGIFLSGGIDSSLVAANAATLAGTQINTFSIGFENAQFNEAIYARRVAGFLGTNHHEFTVRVSDAVDMLDKYIQAYGEPFADSSGIPTLLVSKLARQYVTVTLSGEGGDELFHGYGSYKWATRLNNPLLFNTRWLLANIMDRLPGRYKRIAELLRCPDKAHMQSHIFSQEQYYFSMREIGRMLSKDIINSVDVDASLEYTDKVFSAEMQNITHGRRLSSGERQALYDTYYYLPDDLLTKVDRASMHYSLETRVPYLDHRLVEHAINIDPHLKTKSGTKFVLEEILYQYIPPSYFNRPKRGFSIPLQMWLKKEMKFLIEDHLNKAAIEKAKLVDPGYVKELLERFNKGEDYLYQRVWLLINLHRWFFKNAL